MYISEDYLTWKNSTEQRDEGFKLAYIDGNPLRWFFGYLEGKYAFRIEAKDCLLRPVFKSSKAIEVGIYPDSKKLTILFELIDDDFKQQFIGLFENLIDCSISFDMSEKAVKAVAKSYLRWSKLFSADSPLLSESQIQGLFGELTFIVEESSIRGINEVVKSWCGIDFEEVDFVFPDTWAEIKTKSRLRSTVTISSPGQLDHANDGHLFIFSVDCDDAGISLNDLFNHVLEMIRETGDVVLEDGFRRRLEDFGYYVLPVYDKPRYLISERREYLVSFGFPIVKRNVMLPNIKSIKYELIIDSLEQWRIK